MDYQARYEEWVRYPFLDEDIRRELQEIKDNEKEKEERFYTDLTFGTAGLRGIIGAGTNRMNIYTVRRATQGLADYISSQGENAKARGVVIAFDSRFESEEFALEAALVMAANGIKAYLFDELRPTPELSFAVRELGTIAGIVITASHNPAQYNGYKVYWEDGAQIPPERADEVLARIRAMDSYFQAKYMDRDDAVRQGLLTIIGSEIDKKYLDKVQTLSIQPDIIREVADTFTLIYTPLHGTGNKPVRSILNRIGLKNVIVVKEQENPDPSFSTVKSPNPEEHDAFKIAIRMAKEKNVDVIIGTDPDCDRVGVVVKDRKGEYNVLTGNQTGCLLLHYILSQKKATGTLPINGVVVKTIVTTEMARAIAQSYDTEIEDVLTGFKFIGEKIQGYEETGSKEYLFGFEESYGYLAGTFVRDKDGVIASMLIAETAAYYKSKGMSLYDGLQELFQKYGYFKEGLTSFTLQGKEGLEKIKETMNTLRMERPAKFGDTEVSAIRDYLAGKRYEVKTGKETLLALPQSNVLYFEMVDGSWLCIRPSGTEPRIKIYYAVCKESNEEADRALANLKDTVLGVIQDLVK